MVQCLNFCRAFNNWFYLVGIVVHIIIADHFVHVSQTFANRVKLLTSFGIVATLSKGSSQTECKEAKSNEERLGHNERLFEGFVRCTLKQ